MNNNKTIKSINQIKVEVTLNDGSNAIVLFADIKDPVIDIVNTRKPIISNGLIIGEELKEQYTNIIFGASVLSIVEEDRE